MRPIAQQVLGKTPRIAIEAGLRQSWDWLLDETDSFIGMTGFGASAPIDDLYNHFGITADAVVRSGKTPNWVNRRYRTA